MKKICFVDFDMSVTGGVEKVLESLANAFCERYEVYVFSINGKGKEIPYHLDERITYHAELRGKTRLREMIIGFFVPFQRFVKEHKIDTVILMGNYPALIASFTRLFNRAKYIYCDHGALLNQWHQKDITAIRFWDALAAHKVVVLTEQTKQDYIRKFRLSPKKVTCIYNWIEPYLLKVKKPYDSQSKQILTVGRFGPEKGYDLLVETAAKVLKKYPDWEWHLYGTGELFEQIQGEIQTYQLQEQVRFMGNVPDAYKQYHKYAFLVLPSYREGLPVVLLEAKALGLPMISFDVMTGPNEIIHDGQDGFLIPPYDCEQMANKVECLIENQELREQLSKGTILDLDKFEFQTILQKWEILLDHL